MHDSPDIVFTAIEGLRREQLWNEDAQRAARDLGFDIRLNPHPAPLSDDQWADLFEGAEAIITTWGAPRLDNGSLAKNDTLRFVGHAAGSVAGIVSPELFARGVRVCTANQFMARSVARWCVMMTMIGLPGLIHCAQFGAAGSLGVKNKVAIRDPRDCVIGVWGYGDVAKSYIEMIRILEPAEIIVCDDYLTEEMARQAGVRKAPLDEVFERADVIQLLQSLTGRSSGKVGRKQLAAIKDGAILVNAGRAGVTQYDALVEAMEQGRFLGIFDVHHKEPLPEDSPFRNMRNCILTPHIAGREGRGRYVRLMLEEFARFLRGDDLQYEVTFERAMRMTGANLEKGRK